MRKFLKILLLLTTLTTVGYTKHIPDNGKIAEEYVKAQNYEVISCEGESHKYILEKSNLFKDATSTQHQQIWAVQTIKPDKYFGKEISVYCFKVNNHPLEKMLQNKINIYIMISEGEFVGGYAFPDGPLGGSFYSLAGKTIEESTGLSHEEWQYNLKKEYGN